MTEPISYHRRDQLREAFDASVKLPWWTRPWKAADAVPDSVSASVAKVPVKLTGLAAMIGLFTMPMRLRYMAYYWLYPYERPYGLEGLDGLLEVAGLLKLERGKVLTDLIHECGVIGRQFPRLDRWVQTRVELLKFSLAKPLPYNAAGHDVMLVRRALHMASASLQQDPDGARQLAARAVDQALRGAALAVLTELGSVSPGQQIHASLMIPVDDPATVLGYLQRLGMAVQEPYDRATQLWAGIPGHVLKQLILVAETRKAHAGFWTPVVEGETGLMLPGAPQAYQSGIGSTVIFNDPSPLVGFPIAVQRRWTNYLPDNLQGKLFVSLPLLAPSSGGAGQTVLAVANFNGYPEVGHEWYRGYVPEWLARARDAAAPWLECAVYAWQYHAMAAAACQQQPVTCELDGDSADWNMLTGEQNGASLVIRYRP